MYELVQVSEKCYYINCPAKIGVYVADKDHVYLSFLYGSYPCKDLRHKFLMAQESNVTDFSDESFPKEIEAIPLPGHFFDMVGFRMPDDVVFLADCISSRETLDKYAVSFKIVGK